MFCITKLLDFFSQKIHIDPETNHTLDVGDSNDSGATVSINYSLSFSWVNRMRSLSILCRLSVAILFAIRLENNDRTITPY